MTTSDPQIRAVVFDLDGLMLNTEDVFSLAGIELLARRGQTMTPHIHRSMLGRRPQEAFQALKDLAGLAESIEDLQNETRELFSALAPAHLQVMPGLTDLLDGIAVRNLPVAVATSSPRDYVIDMLSRFDLLDRFPLMLTAEDVVRGKPHPEIYQTAARLLDVDPCQMLVLEDSETGSRAAATAGAFTVAVPNQHTEHGDFSIASLVVPSLRDERIYALLG